MKAKNTQYRKNSLESRIMDLIGSDCGEKEIEVYAFELNKHEGYWSVNSGWRMATGTLEDCMDSIRDRWEVFKVNYAPRGRVCDITDDGDENTIYLECDQVSFLEIRIAE